MKNVFLLVILNLFYSLSTYANDLDDWIDVLIKSSWKNIDDSVTAYDFAREAVVFAKNNNNSAAIGNAYVNLANISRHYRIYSDAVNYYEKAVYHYSDANQFEKITELLCTKGRYHYDLGEYKDAMKDFIRGLRIYDSLDLNNDTKAWLLRYIGSVFKREGDQRKALQYYNQAFDEFVKLDDADGMASSLNNIGNVYGILEDESLQLEYYKKALRIAEEHDLKWRAAIILDNIGSIYSERYDFESAMMYFDKSYIYLSQRDKPDYDLLSINYQNRARLFYLNNNNTKALELLKEAERLILKTEKKQKLELRDIYKLYADLYKDEGDFKKAYEYYLMYDELSDSLENAKTAIEIERLQLGFERDRELERNETERVLNDVRFSNQARIMNWLILGSILFVIFSLVFFIQKRKIASVNVVLQDSLKKEKALGYLKSRFVSTASHQFRTPLTVIKANVSLLDMHNDAIREDVLPIYNKCKDRINEQIDNMTALMNQVLLLSKINSGTIKPNIEKVDIVELCADISQEISSIQDDGRNTTFESEIEIGIVLVDPNLARQAISNVLSNAFKYSQGRKPPKVRVGIIDRRIEISIRDSGIGIPEEDLNLLFQPFFRASNTDGIFGTGLGISVAREYVEMMSGEIEVKSTENEGTEFIIRFDQAIQ